MYTSASTTATVKYYRDNRNVIKFSFGVTPLKLKLNLGSICICADD